MMRWFYQQRFVRGLRQREIASMLRVGVPAISKRERRIRQRFAAAGLPEPLVTGRRLFRVTCRSL